MSANLIEGGENTSKHLVLGCCKIFAYGMLEVAIVGLQTQNTTEQVAVEKC